MQLKPLFRMRLQFPRGWSARIKGENGSEAQHFYVVEGACEGKIAGRLHGVNHPRQRTDLTMCPNFQGVIETDDGATILFDIRGYGRAHPPGRRAIVNSATFVTEDPRYAFLNDALAVGAGEVRAPTNEEERKGGADGSIRSAVELVIDWAELVWEPPAP